MLTELINWTNSNAGFVSLLIFLIALFLGWVSGIFRNLRRRPNFRLKDLPGPTLCATFLTGMKHEGYDVHRTAISIYLSITNIGSAPSSIESVSVGYHWHLSKINWLWLRYRLFWFWLDHPIITMDDFQYDFGERIKIFPSLLQGTSTLGTTSETYLTVGRGVNGVVYFEQDDSWGGCFPSPRKGATKIRVAVLDSFGKKHKKTFYVPVVSLQEVRKYNPSFGGTFAVMREERPDAEEKPNNALSADS